MSNEEIIKYIEEHALISDDVKDAAIEALRKQAPKKPEDKRYFRSFKSYAGLCPVCRCGVNSEFQYCGDCGQKLEWG